jgi:multiple sugar transport system ATP-binding protein
MTMADHVVVMRDGIIEQQGAPLDLYDRPANRFVAGFIGSPAMNFIPAIVADDGKSLILDFGAVKQRLAINRAIEPGRKLIAGVRPEHIEVVAPGQGSLDVPIAFVESTGSSTFIVAATEPELTIVETRRDRVKTGDMIGLSVDPAQIHLFDASTDRLI